MQSIQGINSSGVQAATATPSGSTTGADFDQILQQETIIYAASADDDTFMDASGNIRVQPSDTTRTTANTTSTSDGIPQSMDAIFEEAAQTYGISKSLLTAVAKAESNYNASAMSGAGAIGVMQLMPDTADSLGVSDPYDAKQNIFGGAKYLSDLLSQYGGDTSLALAAYNAGSGNVAKYGGVPPFEETQQYVAKVLDLAGLSENVTAAADREGNNDTAAATVIYAVAANSATRNL